MNDNHKYLTCMYLIKLRSKHEKERQDAFDQGNKATVKQVTQRLEEIKSRLHSEFRRQYEDICHRMTQHQILPADLTEIWLINEISKK